MLIGVEIVHMSTFKPETVDKNSSSSLAFPGGIDDDFFPALVHFSMFQ